MTKDEWRRQALCRGLPVGPFFRHCGTSPQARARAVVEQQRLANICAVCPVRPECVADAALYGDAYAMRGGVWFDLPSQRRKVIYKVRSLGMTRTSTNSVEQLGILRRWLESGAHELRGYQAGRDKRL